MCKFAHTKKQNYFCVDYLRNEATNDKRDTPTERQQTGVPTYA